MTAICIPWRPSATRQSLFEVVTEHYAETLPDFPIYTSDSEGPVFSRSRAINRTVIRAFEAGHEVAVINDADTLCGTLPLHSAIAKTSTDKKSRLPYDKYILMDQAQTNRYVNTHEVTGGAYEGACSGILVVHRDTWYKLGGFDERYIGWGYEDIDFAIRHQFEREHGTCWGMWHPPEDRSESAPANLRLLRDTYGEDV